MLLQRSVRFHALGPSQSEHFEGIISSIGPPSLIGNKEVIAFLDSGIVCLKT